MVRIDTLIWNNVLKVSPVSYAIFLILVYDIVVS